MIATGWNTSEGMIVQISRKCSAARVVLLRTRGPTLVNYFTLHNVWTARVLGKKEDPNNTMELKWYEPVPTSKEHQCVLSRYIPFQNGDPNSMETRQNILRILREQLNEEETEARLIGEGRSSKCGAGYMQHHGDCGTSSGHCIKCASRDHHSEWHSHIQWPSKISISCKTAKPDPKPRSYRGNQDLTQILFGRYESSEQTQDITRMDLDQPDPAPNNEEEPTDHESGTDVPPTNPTEGDASIKHRKLGQKRTGGLNVMTWNTGKHIKHAFGRNYMQAMIHCMVTEEVDILMLQEAEGMITDDQGLLREGFRLERHGKVAIVTCIDTTETLRIGTVWRSPNFNSMGITLRLRDDSTIGVLTSYLPSDIDDMAMESPHYDRVTLQHEELVAQAAAHDQSIVGFDANETRSRTERILIRKAKKIIPTRECQRCPENERAGHCGRFHDWDTEYTGTKRLHSHLDVYRKNFKDSHRTAPGNGHLYDKSGPTHRDALTHTMPARNMDLSYAKLDYIWVSNDMAVRITGSTLNHETKGWSGKHSTDSYHSAILTKMEWANIWRGQDDQKRTELPEGEDVVRGPNLSNLNPETEEQINVETERRFAEIRPKLNEIYNNSSTYGKRTEQEALDYITNEWYRVALDSAIKYLGKATPPAERMQGGSVNNQSKKWDQVYDDLKKASLTGEANLKKVMESERTRESLLWLEDRKVYVPKALEEVKAWLEARDFHRSAVIRVGMDCALDDKATQMKKKRMSASLKPLCAPKFGPYRNEAGKLITDSHEIAKDILAYTKKIASTKESTPLPITSAEEVKVKGILKTPTLEEVREAVRDQSDTANAPGISPRMVKVICLGESTEIVRKTRKEQEYDELKEKQASYQEKKDWLQKALDTGRILPEPDHKPIDEPGGDQNDPNGLKKRKDKTCRHSRSCT